MTLLILNSKVDSFMKLVVPSLVMFISDCNLNDVNRLLRILLERHNVLWLTRSKVGLAIMTMVLSRGEILKQDSGTASELATWTELYLYLFDNLSTNFLTVFTSSAPQEQTPQQSKDETYAWQFLSAVAVTSTTTAQQSTLVTELRERMIDTARAGGDRGVRNVDLFLSALGLDIDAATLASLSG